MSSGCRHALVYSNSGQTKIQKNDLKEEDFDESGVTLRSQPYYF